jgi:hypothetical protein
MLNVSSVLQQAEFLLILDERKPELHPQGEPVQ